MNKKEYSCVVCGKKCLKYKRPDKKFPSEERACCSNACRAKFLSKTLIGKNNPNYKNGKHCDVSCSECGLKKDYRAKLCSRCSKRGFPIDNGDPDWKNNLEKLKKVVSESRSYSEVGEKLQISRTSIKKYINQENLDISHFRPGRARFMSEEEVLSFGSRKRHAVVKAFLIRNNLLQYKCQGEGCIIVDNWNDGPLTLELHHVDGNPKNNRLDNLVFLCPNCHSQTTNYKGKKRE